MSPRMLGESLDPLTLDFYDAFQNRALAPAISGIMVSVHERETLHHIHGLVVSMKQASLLSDPLSDMFHSTHIVTCLFKILQFYSL